MIFGENKTLVNKPQFNVDIIKPYDLITIWFTKKRHSVLKDGKTTDAIRTLDQPERYNGIVLEVTPLSIKFASSPNPYGKTNDSLGQHTLHIRDIYDKLCTVRIASELPEPHAEPENEL